MVAIRPEVWVQPAGGCRRRGQQSERSSDIPQRLERRDCWRCGCCRCRYSEAGGRGRRGYSRKGGDKLPPGEANHRSSIPCGIHKAMENKIKCPTNNCKSQRFVRRLASARVLMRQLCPSAPASTLEAGACFILSGMTG